MDRHDAELELIKVITIKNYAMWAYAPPALEDGANASIEVNAALLHGIRSKRDVQQMPVGRYHCLVAAMRAAAELVARAARGAEVRLSV